MDKCPATNKKGQYYYPVKLRNAYKEYLNNQGKAGQ